MPSPFFTSTESDIQRLEGLYVKERLPPAEISGVVLNDVCIVSEAIRGPVGKAVLCSSPARVREVFGGRDQGSGGNTTSPLWRALLNKPFSRIWVVRAAAAAAVKATVTLSNVTPTAIVRVDASSVGAWGLNLTCDVVAASNGNANHFNLVVKYLGGSKTYQNLNLFTASDDNTAIVLGDDDANWITLTKLANGRPINTTANAFASGADGTIADSDFTASLKGINIAAQVKKVGVCFIAERMSATLKAAILTKSASTPDRMWLIGPDADTTSAATAITDVATYRSDRIVYTYGHHYTLDPETATNILVRPESLMASIFSQTDPDTHVGEEDTKAFTKGVSYLVNETFERGDYIAFKDAGICALEKDTNGYSFVSGVTTSLTPGLEQIARRRSADFVLISIAENIKFFVKKKNTETRRKVIMGLIDAFLDGLELQERICERHEIKTDGEAGNSDASRSLGQERVLVRIKLISHMLYLVLEGEIGTNVKFTEAA